MSKRSIEEISFDIAKNRELFNGYLASNVCGKTVEEMGDIRTYDSKLTREYIQLCAERDIWERHLMTEADLSALTASLPGLMKLAAILKTRELTHRFDDNGEVTWSNTSDDLGRSVAIAFEQTAKSLMQVMGERDAAWNSLKLIHQHTANLEDEAPSMPFDNGGTSDGWRWACKHMNGFVGELISPTIQRPAPATQETK